MTSLTFDDPVVLWKPIQHKRLPVHLPLQERNWWFRPSGHRMNFRMCMFFVISHSYFKRWICTDDWDNYGGHLSVIPMQQNNINNLGFVGRLRLAADDGWRRGGSRESVPTYTPTHSLPASLLDRHAGISDGGAPRPGTLIRRSRSGDNWQMASFRAIKTNETGTCAERRSVPDDFPGRRQATRAPSFGFWLNLLGAKDTRWRS